MVALALPLPALPSAPRPDWPAIWRAVLEDETLLARMLRKRTVLGHGTYGVVYELAGAAVKIGHVDEEEAKIQEWVGERFPGRALPVWAYRPRVKVPRVVTRQICPIHGFSKLDEENWSCHCGEPMDILVMPVATSAPEAWRDPRIQRLAHDIAEALWADCEFVWDAGARNLLRYRNRIVLADFGWDDVEGW